MSLKDIIEQSEGRIVLIDATPKMTLHRDIDSQSECGGQVSTRAPEMFGTDYWCVYCGAKFDKEGS